MATRKELIAAVGTRYRVATKAEHTSILDEFTALTGFHRKHAIRALTKVPRGERQTRALTVSQSAARVDWPAIRTYLNGNCGANFAQ